MTYLKIYKIKIQKEKEKLYNLWWSDLIKLQKKYIKILEKMLGRWYQLVLQELKDNRQVLFNDLFIDQKQFITKEYSTNNFASFSKMMRDGFNIWAKQLNASFKKDIKIDTTFGIDPWDSLKYANEFAWARIKGIDDYSRKRINNVISQGIENGWWYQKLANELKRDYSFSNYRASLIASQEIWQAYIEWKDRQFDRYRKQYNQDWWKQWISHRDDRTTDWCLENDNEWWIEYEQDFASWHARPTRFPWCRCNVVYRLFKPDDYGLTNDNADIVDQTQSEVPVFTWFDEWIKPVNYDKLSTQVVPATYFNAIWKQITYIKTKKRAFWQNLWKQLNMWKQASEYEKQYTEAHELWHAFFDNVVIPKEENLLKFKVLFTDSVDEMLDLYKTNDDIKEILKLKKLTALWYAKKIFEKIPSLEKVKWYSMKEEILTYKRKIFVPQTWWEIREKEVLTLITSPQLSEHVLSFYDLIWSMTREQLWAWHGARYYRWSKNIFDITLKSWKLNSITEMQAHEFFAHLNEAYFMNNEIIKEILPEIYKAMKDFYKSIWFDPFI